MTAKEERLQILNMLQDGKIGADEAASLLSALETGMQREESSNRSVNMANMANLKGRWLRIRVTEGHGGKSKVNVNLPLGVVNAALKLGSRFVPELNDMDIDELRQEIHEAVESGMSGKIVEVHDDEDGDHVEIFIE